MYVHSKAVCFKQLLLIASLIFLTTDTSAANQTSDVCYIKEHCTQGSNSLCCYKWSVNNFKKLANSNTTLYISSGVFNLNGNIQITTVNNFTLIGGNNTIFVCEAGFYFSAVNSSFIHIANVKFSGCSYIEDSIDPTKSAAFYLLDSSSVSLTNVVFHNICGYGIIGINIASNSMLKNITICQSNKNTNCHCQKQFRIGGIMWLYNKIVTPNSAKLFISDIIIYNITNNRNCSYSSDNSSAISLLLHHQKCIVNISNAVIVDVTSTNVPLVFVSISSISTPFIIIKNISYHNNNVYTVLKVVNTGESSISLHISNHTFYNNTVYEYLASFSNVTPLFKGFILFENNMANVILRFNKYITLYKKAVVSFSHNRPSPLKQTFHRFVIERWDETSKECPFQLTSKTNLMYTSIKFCSNKGYFREVYIHSFLHNCIWNSANITGEYSPDLETLYKYIIRTCDNEIKTIKFGKENDICQCNSRNSCLVHEPSNPVYPGQSVYVNVKSSYNLLVQTETDNNPFEDFAPTCDVVPSCNNLYHRCTKLSYTIEINGTLGSKCLILLSTTKRLIYGLYITTNNCPKGFFLTSNGICNCHPKLQNLLKGIICNISDKTFKLPTNYWISTNSYDEIIFTTYCKYGYCIQTPTNVLLNTPDDQCLLNRSGISCGKCKKGLSTVLGTKACKRCTNNGLFLIILFAFAGILLVLLLFLLNLTVVNGDIYGFIFFVNVLGVNSSETFATNYVIVALSNLDWGIESCFYYGMTSYAVTWLQFIFPVYVLLIVVGLVIASRYSAKIERLTRTKVIPVIATLLLLPYNKIIIITFSGLFSYTTIHYLNSKRTEVYWAIDTSISLFGAKHLLLFIFCAIILLCVIIPINILLLFTKSFYQFKIVTKKLKPFIDAYQAPFRDECRYLLGLELLLRVVVYMVYHFFGRQAAAIYITIILLYTAYICWIKPFKSHCKLFIYLLYLLYLGVLTILFLHYSVINMEPNKTYKIIFKMVVFAGFVQFLMIVAYHVWKNILCHFNYCKERSQKFQLNQFAFKMLNKDQEDAATQSKNSITDSRIYHKYRDDLLMLD